MYLRTVSSSLEDFSVLSNATYKWREILFSQEKKTLMILIYFGLCSNSDDNNNNNNQ